MARPSIITDLLIERFRFTLSVSDSIESAIEETKIGRESYYRWRRRVRQGCGSELERRFMKVVDRTKEEHKAVAKTGINDNWRMLAAWLERRYPDEYGIRLSIPELDSEEEG
jgi:hypothetical protein